MARSIELVGDEYDLEYAMLLQSIAEFDCGSHRCGCCGRMPLTGEYVFSYPDGSSDCEYCRLRRTDAPQATLVQVRRGGGHLTVRAVPRLAYTA